MISLLIAVLDSIRGLFGKGGGRGRGSTVQVNPGYKEHQRAIRRRAVPAVRGDTPDSQRWWIFAAGLVTLLALVGLTVVLAWGLNQPLPFSNTSGSIVPSNGRDAASWISATLLILVLVSAFIPEVANKLRGRWGGGSWGWLKVLAVRWQDFRRERLFKRASAITTATTGGTSSPSAVTGSVIDLLYPSSDALRPTALGNALAAVDGRVSRRHAGLPLVAAWPRLRHLLSDAERGLLGVRERRTQTLVTVTAASLVAFGVTSAIAIGTAFFGFSWPLLIGPAAAVIAGRSAYRSAINAAVLEGIAIEAAVDVHLEDFLKAMGVPADIGPESRHKAFAVLFDPATSVEQTLRALRIDGGDNAVTERLLADIRRSVKEEVASSLTSAVVAAPVTAAVRASIKEYVEGEPLVNYDGVLSVWLYDGNGAPVPVGDDRIVALEDGFRYELGVTIAPSAVPGAATVPLSIGTGVTEEVAPFEVAVDSDVRGLRHSGLSLDMRPGETRNVTFPLDVDVNPPPRWIWIRVAQRGRTVQNFELSTDPRQPDE